MPTTCSWGCLGSGSPAELLLVGDGQVEAEEWGIAFSFKEGVEAGA